MSKYDNRILNSLRDERQPITEITGWEWYDRDQVVSTFLFIGSRGYRFSLLWEEWAAYKEWLHKQPTMWEKFRKERVDSLASQAKAIGIVDRKVIGRNGSKKAIPSTIKGQEVPVIQFEDVDCNKLEQNVELFERLLEATAEMTPDGHCEAFKRLQQTIE